MATSRTEDMLAELIVELETISVANGYRTTPNQVINAIRDPDAVRDFPEIGIELGAERLIPLDDNWSVMDTVVDVYIVGHASAATSIDDDSSELVAATEALRHDIKRIVYKVMHKYINAALSKWNITPKQTISTEPTTGLGEKRNKAIVATSFSVRVGRQGSSFIDNADAQDFGTTGTGKLDGGQF